MPSFSKETLEQWRRERVSGTSVPDGMDSEQAQTMRQTLKDDLREERERLELARAQVVESESLIEVLTMKAKLLCEKYGLSLSWTLREEHR